MTDDEFYNAISNDAVAFFKTLRSLAITYHFEYFALSIIAEMWDQIKTHKTNDEAIQRAKGIVRIAGGWAEFDLIMYIEGFKNNYDVGFDGSVN